MHAPHHFIRYVNIWLYHFSFVGLIQKWRINETSAIFGEEINPLTWDYRGFAIEPVLASLEKIFDKKKVFFF